MTLRTVVASLWKVSLLILLVVGIESCTQKSTSSTSTAAYQEDLSLHRPQVAAYVPTKVDTNRDGGSTANNYPAPTNHIKDEIDQIVEKTIDYNQSKRYVNGYAIQVYSGTESREKDQAELKVYALERVPRTTYTQPIYKVKIGQFYTRLEATKFLNEVRTEIPAAHIVFEKIRVK